MRSLPLRSLVLGLVLAILAAPLAAEGQQVGKTPRIGLLILPPPDAVASRTEAFRHGLRNLGYIEGRDVIIEYRYAHGVMDRLPALAADLVRLKVDIIVAPGNQSISAARRATSTIPIVAIFAVDPIGQGLITSYARPGGNITGVAWDQDVAITGKYLEFLREVVPNLSQVVGLIDPSAGVAAYRRSGETSARSMGLLFPHVEIRDPSELDKAFEAITRQRAQAVLVYGSALIFPHLVGRIVELTAKHRLPAIYTVHEAVALGGLMAYGINLIDPFRRAARYVVEILKGANPAVLPMEQPTKYELVINLKTAKALGLTIPRSLLERADQVIE